jgi:aspartate/methionine/tyrosine aminotransferase
VHPNNPTGSFVTTGEQRALIDLAGECGLALLVDEVFGDYAVGDDRDRAGSFAGSAEVLTCVLSGLSKVAGLPQLKLSWLVVQGPEAERREALARLEVIADTYLSVASPVQEALPALLGWRGPVQEAIRRRVRENLRHAQLRLPGAGVGRLLPCEGGWYAVIDLGPRDEDPVVLGLLEEDGVLVHPGYFYDFGREGFVVLSLLTPEEQFAHGLERLLQRVR